MTLSYLRESWLLQTLFYDMDNFTYFSSFLANKILKRFLINTNTFPIPINYHPLKGNPLHHWANLKALPLEMICAKFDYFGSCEEDKHVNSLQTTTTTTAKDNGHIFIRKAYLSLRLRLAKNFKSWFNYLAGWISLEKLNFFSILNRSKQKQVWNLKNKIWNKRSWQWYLILSKVSLNLIIGKDSQKLQFCFLFKMNTISINTTISKSFCPTVSYSVLVIKRYFRTTTYQLSKHKK